MSNKSKLFEVMNGDMMPVRPLDTATMILECHDMWNLIYVTMAGELKFLNIKNNELILESNLNPVLRKNKSNSILVHLFQK